MNAYVRPWSFYVRIDGRPAPPLWDVVKRNGHIVGPFKSRDVAQRVADRMNAEAAVPK